MVTVNTVAACMATGNYGHGNQGHRDCYAIQAVCCQPANIDMDRLKAFARDVAEFFELPKGTPFIEDRTCCSLFDFSSRYLASAMRPMCCMVLNIWPGMPCGFLRMKASGLYLDLHRAPRVLYGVKYIGLVSLDAPATPANGAANLKQ